MTSQENFSRREFGKYLAGIVTAAGTFIVFRGSETKFFDPRSLFLTLQEDFTTPEDVASEFVRAKTPFLMASYSVFFPTFLIKNGYSAVDLISKAVEKVKQKYLTNHHRLDALPAVTAAHLLRTAKEDRNRHVLSSEISKALSDSRREVREIVLQNLITSVAPNIDSVRFLSIEHEVLSILMQILEHAEDNPKLLTTVGLIAEFLLNTKALLIRRKEPVEILKPYTSLLERICNSNASHFWYVARLIEVHEKTFTADPYDQLSLPPQSTESLMGWKSLNQSRDYLEVLVLMRSYHLFMNFATATGTICSDTVMNMGEAKRALPKTIALFRDFDLAPLINFDLVEAAPKQDREFKKFLHGMFHQVITNPDRIDMGLSIVKTSEEEILLANCVPFSQYDNYALFTPLAREFKDESRRMLFKNIKAVISSLVTGYSAYSGSDKIIEFIERKFGPLMSTRNIPKTHIETQVEKLEKKERQIEAGDYIGLEEQQNELGPIPLPKSFDGEKK